MLSAACRADGGPTARRAARTGAAALLLAFACSRTPGPLQVATRGESHPDVGTGRMNLAILHLMKGNHDACIESAEKALKILVDAFGERHALVIQTYNAMGAAYPKKGDPDRGLAVLEKARVLQLSLAGSGDRNSAASPAASSMPGPRACSSPSGP